MVWVYVVHVCVYVVYVVYVCVYVMYVCMYRCLLRVHVYVSWSAHMYGCVTGWRGKPIGKLHIGGRRHGPR